MITTCKLCFNTFEAKRKTATFCCDLHRTLFGKLSNEEKIEKTKQLAENSLGNLSEKVTTADNIETQAMFDKALEEHPNPSADKYKQSPESDIFWANMKGEGWISKIEAYCGEAGITPEDLILSHKERNKPQKSKKGIKGSNEEEKANKGISDGKPSRSNWFKDYKKAKTGISE